MANPKPSLGANLQAVRKRQGLSLRALERASGLTSGYLSQLERGEVQQPTPTSLGRVADAYGLDLQTVMEWAGYGSGQARTLTAEQSLALKYLGENPTEKEVEAIRAVLDVLRANRPGFAAPHLIDRPLHQADVGVIRQHALALLREADALGRVPTQLDDLTSVAELVYAGEIELSLREQRRLIRQIGRTMLDRILGGLEGMISFSAREIWLKPDLVEVRRRFVHAHELGHHVLPVHRQLAYLDDRNSLSPTVREACEREANQAAIEILAQGPRLVEESDDSAFSADHVDILATKYRISLQATARRVAEESAHRRCVVTRYRGSQSGKLMPPHVYASPRFASIDQPLLDLAEVARVVREDIRTGDTAVIQGTSVGQQANRLSVSAIETPRAQIVVIEARPAKRLIRRRG